MGLGRFKIGSNRRLRTLLLLIVALFATGLGIVAYGTHLLRGLELSTVNTRFSIRGKEKAPKNIVIVGVDSKSFGEVNKQWPFPRAVEGAVLSRIAQGNPAVVGFDIIFSQPSDLGQSDDNALLKAIIPAKTVFAIEESDATGEFEFLGSNQGRELVQQVGANAASTNAFEFDPGGTYRRFVYFRNGLQTFPVDIAQLASGSQVNASKFSGGSAWIDYAGGAGTFQTVSYGDVYTGKIPASFFANKIVLIGATAPGLQDLHSTSTDPAMPGTEAQANAISTILRGFPLSGAPGWLNIALIVLLGLAVPLASLRLGAVASVGLAVVLGLIYALIVQLAFNGGLILSFVYPLGALILAGIGSLAVQLVTEAFERIRTRDLFSRFVPENVVDELLASSEGLRLGGAQRAATVMFTDLRGFTSFAESLTPPQVIDVLNHYLSEMSDAILDHGGTLVAYMGDGIFAVFGAPLEMADHADRALATAREMLEVRLPRFNEWIKAQGLGDGFRMGIGLNSGNVMSGHVGSERRVEYAAVGDTTNTASRLESMTKGTPHQLFLSQSTHDALTRQNDDLVYVDEVAIRGRVERLRLWSIKGPAPAEAGPASGDQPVSEPVS